MSQFFSSFTLSQDSRRAYEKGFHIKFYYISFVFSVPYDASVVFSCLGDTGCRDFCETEKLRGISKVEAKNS